MSKKYLRWCRTSKRFEWYPLDPPLFWLDNIFKPPLKLENVSRTHGIKATSKTFYRSRKKETYHISTDGIPQRPFLPLRSPSHPVTQQIPPLSPYTPPGPTPPPPGIYWWRSKMNWGDGKGLLGLQRRWKGGTDIFMLYYAPSGNLMLLQAISLCHFRPRLGKVSLKFNVFKA